MNQQTRWINAVLCNDETSSDEELIAYFIENGVDTETAKALVAKRDDYMGNINIPG